MKILIYYTYFNKYWLLPFYLYIRSIYELLINNNIETAIVGDLKEVSDDDIVILFHPWKNIIDCVSNKIIYVNSEPLYVDRFESLKGLISNEKIILWIDYTNKNTNMVNQVNSNLKTVLNHFIYTDFCERHYLNHIGKNKITEKDTDILFFGGINVRRKRVIDKLRKRFTVKIVNAKLTELYSYLGKSKVIIVIHHYEEDLPIDYYRIATLVSNKILFVHEEVQLEDKNSIYHNLIMSPYDKMFETCGKYLSMTQEERDNIALGIYEHFKSNNYFENSFPIGFIQREIAKSKSKELTSSII